MSRVPYIKREQLPATDQKFYDRIGGPRGGVPKVFQLFLNSPEFGALIADVGAHARFVSKVPAEVRETVILTTSREIGCQYEFTHHLPLAQQAGVRDLVIEGIKAKTTKGMLPKEAVFVDYTRQVINRRVNGPTYQAVEHLLGQQGTVDLTMTIGYYLMLGTIMMALDVELEDGSKPLMPEG